MAAKLYVIRPTTVSRIGGYIPRKLASVRMDRKRQAYYRMNSEQVAFSTIHGPERLCEFGMFMFCLYTRPYSNKTGYRHHRQGFHTGRQTEMGKWEEEKEEGRRGRAICAVGET